MERLCFAANDYSCIREINQLVIMIKISRN